MERLFIDLTGVSPHEISFNSNFIDLTGDNPLEKSSSNSNNNSSNSIKNNNKDLTSVDLSSVCIICKSNQHYNSSGLCTLPECTQKIIPFIRLSSSSSSSSSSINQLKSKPKKIKSSPKVAKVTSNILHSLAKDNGINLVTNNNTKNNISPQIKSSSITASSIKSSNNLTSPISNNDKPSSSFFGNMASNISSVLSNLGSTMGMNILLNNNISNALTNNEPSSSRINKAINNSTSSSSNNNSVSVSDFISSFNNKDVKNSPNNSNNSIKNIEPVFQKPSKKFEIDFFEKQRQLNELRKKENELKKQQEIYQKKLHEQQERQEQQQRERERNISSSSSSNIINKILPKITQDNVIKGIIPLSKPLEPKPQQPSMLLTANMSYDEKRKWARQRAAEREGIMIDNTSKYQQELELNNNANKVQKISSQEIQLSQLVVPMIHPINNTIKSIKSSIIVPSVSHAPMEIINKSYVIEPCYDVKKSYLSHLITPLYKIMLSKLNDDKIDENIMKSIDNDKPIYDVRELFQTITYGIDMSYDAPNLLVNTISALKILLSFPEHRDKAIKKYGEISMNKLYELSLKSEKNKINKEEESKQDEKSIFTTDVCTEELISIKILESIVKFSPNDVIFPIECQPTKGLVLLWINNVIKDLNHSNLEYASIGLRKLKVSLKLLNPILISYINSSSIIEDKNIKLTKKDKDIKDNQKNNDPLHDSYGISHCCELFSLYIQLNKSSRMTNESNMNSIDIIINNNITKSLLISLKFLANRVFKSTLTISASSNNNVDISSLLSLSSSNSKINATSQLDKNIKNISVNLLNLEKNRKRVRKSSKDEVHIENSIPDNVSENEFKSYSYLAKDSDQLTSISAYINNFINNKLVNCFINKDNNSDTITSNSNKRTKLNSSTKIFGIKNGNEIRFKTDAIVFSKSSNRDIFTIDPIWRILIASKSFNTSDNSNVPKLSISLVEMYYLLDIINNSEGCILFQLLSMRIIQTINEMESMKKIHGNHNCYSISNEISEKKNKKKKNHFTNNSDDIDNKFFINDKNKQDDIVQISLLYLAADLLNQSEIETNQQKKTILLNNMKAMIQCKNENNSETSSNHPVPHAKRLLEFLAFE